MQIQRVNRTDAEKILIRVYNVSAATMTSGYAVVWDIATADGMRVSKPATATLSLFVGVADEDIVDSAYGDVRKYGYRSAVYVTNDTSVAIAAGDILIPVTAQWYLARSAASDGKGGFVYAGEAFATATTPAAANKKGFLRA